MKDMGKLWNESEVCVKSLNERIKNNECSTEYVFMTNYLGEKIKQAVSSGMRGTFSGSLDSVLDAASLIGGSSTRGLSPQELIAVKAMYDVVESIHDRTYGADKQKIFDEGRLVKDE